MLFLRTKWLGGVHARPATGIWHVAFCKSNLTADLAWTTPIQTRPSLPPGFLLRTFCQHPGLPLRASGPVLSAGGQLGELPWSYAPRQQETTRCGFVETTVEYFIMCQTNGDGQNGIQVCLASQGSVNQCMQTNRGRSYTFGFHMCVHRFALRPACCSRSEGREAWQCH